MSKRAIALIALLSMMVVTLVAGTVGGIVGFAAARLAAPAPAEVRVSQPASAPRRQAACRWPRRPRLRRRRRRAAILWRWWTR